MPQPEAAQPATNSTGWTPPAQDPVAPALTGSALAGWDPTGWGRSWGRTAADRAAVGPAGWDQAEAARTATGSAGWHLAGVNPAGRDRTDADPTEQAPAGSGSAGSGPAGVGRTAGPTVVGRTAARTVVDRAVVGLVGWGRAASGLVGWGRRAGRGVRGGWGSSRRRTSCWQEARPATGSGTRAWRRCPHSTTTAPAARPQVHPGPVEDRAARQHHAWRPRDLPGRQPDRVPRLWDRAGLPRGWVGSGSGWGGGGFGRDRAPVGGSADRQPGRSPGAGSSCPTSMLLTTLLGVARRERRMPPPPDILCAIRTHQASYPGQSSRTSSVPSSPAPPMRPRCCMRSGCARSIRAVPSSCGSAGRRGRARCRSCWRSATATGPATAR